MIQSNEIRCGNWFAHNSEWSYRETGGPFQWDERDWQGFAECTLFLENVEPIPLTPELLEKCGWLEVKLGIRPVAIAGKPYRWQINQWGEQAIYAGHESIDYERPSIILNGIKYVHQLQNLFYAITGQELSINL